MQLTTKTFNQLLQDPQTLTVDQTSEIASFLKNYPYVQCARAIYLKGLKNTNSDLYNQELKTTAAYTTDRSILFDFITSEEFKQNAISKSIKKNFAHLMEMEVHGIEDISVRKSVIIDDALKEHIKNSEPVLDPELFQVKVTPKKVANIDFSNTSTPESEDKKTEISTHISAESKLGIGTPLEFEENETHSFSEWLKLTRFKPIDRSNEVNSETENVNHKEDQSVITSNLLEHKVEQKFELIDRFLESNPKIVPSKEFESKPLLVRDEMPHEGLMTETLARIYLEQKNYDKAIQSYKILSLKYPEKSSFFADQIKAVKEIQAKN
ncbi:tetratricopeptide repeat protein [Aegicerativicinus sediminis]